MYWLDRVSPTIQQSLARYARTWWFKSLVDARRRKGQDLEAVVDGRALERELEEAYGRPYVERDRLLEIIRENCGSENGPVKWLVKWTSYFSSYPSLVRRLELLQLDRGAGFAGELRVDQHMSTLRWRTCLYEEIFSKEEKRELLGCVCCSADRYFFEGQRKYKAGLKLPAKAEGEEECVWYVINRTKRL